MLTHQTMRYIQILVILCMCCFYSCISSSEDVQEPVLYYYGLEESERGLKVCEARQACSALVQRPWQRPGLVRLCRCERRRLRCDTLMPDTHLIHINNVDLFQFCEPTNEWAKCNNNGTDLTVESLYDSMNPDKLEELHHQNIQLIPPKIIVKCKCRSLSYYRQYVNNEREDSVRDYQCRSMRVCKTDEYCGNVSGDMNALYQSGLCPKNHICVHNGGIPYMSISELLYIGKGWRAYCRRIKEDSSSEDYYH